MTMNFKPGRGLDVGTGLIIAAQGVPQGITYREFRNAYVSLPTENRAMLEMSGIPFIEVENKLYAVGDEAVEIAFNTHAEIFRPMAKGLIHPSDTKAKPVLEAIFKALLDSPVVTNEPVFFSTPADPEGESGANIYHTKLIEDILISMGFKPKHVIEGVAVSYAEAREDKFTALCLSFGAGMVNAAVTFKSLPVFTLSVAQGGDWIDAKSAASTGVPSQDITILKEQNVIDVSNRSILVEGLTTQQLREADSIVTHYEYLVTMVVQSLKAYIEANPSRRVNMTDLPVIISGGTAKATGFKALFERLWEEAEMPIKAREIRMADPVQYAVAKGCFFGSQICSIH